MMRRIGDVGVPHTIYYLVELLDFLRPVDPEAVFDLIAHALLQGGARHGYQFESLATDRFAEIMGVYLADHRGLFADSERREKLIACLDIFVEAGWPKARPCCIDCPNCSDWAKGSSRSMRNSLGCISYPALHS